MNLYLNDRDWCAAACADALIADLQISAIQSAHDVSETPEQFFWAVQASIRIKEIGQDRGQR